MAGSSFEEAGYEVEHADNQPILDLDIYFCGGGLGGSFVREAHGENSSFTILYGLDGCYVIRLSVGSKVSRRAPRRCRTKIFERQDDIGGL